MAFILAPLAMAMVITIAMIPLPGWLKQRKVPGGLAIVLTIATLDQVAKTVQGMVSPQMVSQVTAALAEFTAKAIAQVVVVMFIFAFMLTGALSLERSKQSVLGISSPMVGRVEANGDKQPAASTKPVAGEGSAPAP